MERKWSTCVPYRHAGSALCDGLWLYPILESGDNFNKKIQDKDNFNKIGPYVICPVVTYLDRRVFYWCPRHHFLQKTYPMRTSGHVLYRDWDVTAVGELELQHEKAGNLDDICFPNPIFIGTYRGYCRFSCVYFKTLYTFKLSTN
ncbi:hypothetical protein TNCV_383341 [Trichonephila clavipes]|nr:hypothetical protein TNCV_383341 [Trichonephila clavipes]